MESVEKDVVAAVYDTVVGVVTVECEAQDSPCQYLDLDCKELPGNNGTSPVESEAERMQKEAEPLQKEVTVSKKKKAYNCLVCGKKFNQNAGRYNHMKKIHNIYRGDKTNIRCLEKGCSFKCSYKEKLQLHLVEEHGFSMDIRVETFTSYSDFLRWKEEFERQEKTRFVKKSGSRSREKGIRVVYFYCSRSGSSICQGNLEKQNFKRKASTKSNHHCTASITCLELANGHVEVKVCATHYGHDPDLQQLRLSRTDKIQIVEQLIKGVPRDVILDNIRSSASAEVDRIHLITIKDVKNIEKAYRIQSKNKEITSNISSWVTLMNQSEHNPVVYFEEHGTCDPINNFDFTLVLMTVGQIQMAKKYGQMGIFYIPTYATSDNKYFVSSQKAKSTHEIHIATLVVVDSCNDAIPLSFMISTDVSKDRFKLYFDCMKQKVPEIEAKAVLTDDNNDIYEAWESVFAPESDVKPYHLWSNRFVDKDWRDNLICIPNEEVQESIYEKLYSYLESTDETKISNALKEYVDIELLTNPLTIPFGNHFTLKYLGSEHFWAGCYGKKEVAIHAQLNMERLSNQIEEVVDRKHVGTSFIVRTVQDLLKLIGDNQCQRQVKTQKQVLELPYHHRLGLKINPEAISKETETCWRVNSSKDPKNIFSIVTRLSRCNEERCLLFCSKCGTCAHEFQCSCRFYAFDKTMCKHIHAVVITFSDQLQFLASTEDNSQNTEKESDILKPGSFWLRRKRKTPDTDPPTESSPEVAVEEENILKALDEMIHSKKTKGTKRKRGSPKKNMSTENKEIVKNSCDGEKSYRSKVNILRKGKRTSPFKRKKNCEQENSENQ